MVSKKMTYKCECPYQGRHPRHAPNKCDCTNDLKYYKRNGKRICLCMNCTFPGDEEI
jgi:hypothetical protein